MSRFWPHTAYAEEQPYSHAILYTHVLTRAVQAGSIVGATIGSAYAVFPSLPFAPAQPSAAKILLRSTGMGTVIATGLLTVATPARMWGREEIEWQDRSWRLLENKGQVECDDWTYGGMALGAVATAVRGNGMGWRGAAGRVGAGSVLGMVGYMGYRYGMKGGKWEEDKI